ncbi:MAG: hypothetical protein ACHQIM_17220 [Sphingobacteriales bacterium]
MSTSAMQGKGRDHHIAADGFISAHVFNAIFIPLIRSKNEYPNTLAFSRAL